MHNLEVISIQHIFPFKFYTSQIHVLIKLSLKYIHVYHEILKNAILSKMWTYFSAYSYIMYNKYVTFLAIAYYNYD